MVPIYHFMVSFFQIPRQPQLLGNFNIFIFLLFQFKVMSFNCLEKSSIRNVNSQLHKLYAIYSYNKP